MVPGAKEIKVLCAESEEEYMSWYAGCRLAKYGHTLYDNYYRAHIKQFKLEDAEHQSEITAEQRAYSLSGMRLERHLDKRREEYQREKEARELQENMFKKVANEQMNEHEEQLQPSPSIPAPKTAPKPKPKPKPVSYEQNVTQEDVFSLDSLTQYQWYHGSIPRDEAVRRLEQAGARDG